MKNEQDLEQGPSPSNAFLQVMQVHDGGEVCNELAEAMREATAAVLRIVEADKADLVAVLRELGEALDSNAEVNTYTGEFCTLVEPGWFKRLQRAVERHTGARVLEGVAR